VSTSLNHINLQYDVTIKKGREYFFKPYQLQPFITWKLIIKMNTSSTDKTTIETNRKWS